jgi:hypothetical protein
MTPALHPPALFRIYEDDELGKDGYPRAWHSCDYCIGGAVVAEDPENLMAAVSCPTCRGAGSVKQLVRQLAENRCVRCGHPYVVGHDGEWVEEPIDPRTVGMNLKTLGRLFDELPEALAESGLVEGEPVPPTKRVHYSWCDGRCRHGGPGRWRNGPAGEWHRADELGQADSGEILHVLNAQQVQAAYRILTVHHLNGRKFDLRWHNLVALCQRCHLSVQSRVQMERLWPWEHSEWFRPYVAGFYAVKYEGREITREEAEARMGELLAYERQA